MCLHSQNHREQSPVMVKSFGTGQLSWYWIHSNFKPGWQHSYHKKNNKKLFTKWLREHDNNVSHEPQCCYSPDMITTQLEGYSEKVIWNFIFHCCHADQHPRWSVQKCRVMISTGLMFLYTDHTLSVCYNSSKNNWVAWLVWVTSSSMLVHAAS